MSRLDRIETTILDVARQKGAIPIPPDTRSVRKLVIALPQRLFLVRPINVAELGHARVARCELDQLAASRGLSLEHPHEHAGGANLKALAVALALPRFIGQLFGFDRGALTENAIGKLAVAALTLSGETRGMGQEILVASTGFKPSV
jgi:hypothetical protein